MKVLALDTTSLRGSVALREGDELLGLVYLATNTDHSTTLLPAIDYLLAASGLTVEEVGGIAVAAGPGSFSGIRIGLATAKGLAQARQRPLAGVSALHALAHRLRFLPGLICPMVDALRGQVYTTLYRSDGNEVEELAAPVAVAPADWLATLPDAEVRFLGDGLRRHGGLIAAAGRTAWSMPSVVPFLADVIAEIGGRRLERGEGDPVGALDALYIRASDAEINQAARRARE